MVTGQGNGRSGEREGQARAAVYWWPYTETPRAVRGVMSMPPKHYVIIGEGGKAIAAS